MKDSGSNANQQKDLMFTRCKSEVDNQVKDIVTVNPRPIAVVLLLVSRHRVNNQPREMTALSFIWSISEYHESPNLPNIHGGRTSHTRCYIVQHRIEMSNLTGLKDCHLHIANLYKIGARQTVLQNSSNPYPWYRDCAPDIIMKVLPLGSRFNHSSVKHAGSFIFDRDLQGD
jgi:hypothetical protein